jgi:hypothetical protein
MARKFFVGEDTGVNTSSPNSHLSGRLTRPLLPFAGGNWKCVSLLEHMADYQRDPGRPPPPPP